MLPAKRNTPPTKDELKKENPFAVHEIYISKDQVTDFEALLARGASETSVDKFLTDNPEVFAAVLDIFRTGNHAAIVIPKQEIRSRIKIKDEKGLIPDFIIGGKNSDGWNWWIIEIKGIDQTLFAQTGNDTYLNLEINKGVCQLLEYIDFCSEHQATLRETFGLQDFREPKGLLIAGRESEVTGDEKKQKLKAAWNRINAGKLEIRTYDLIQRNLSTLYKAHHRDEE